MGNGNGIISFNLNRTRLILTIVVMAIGLYGSLYAYGSNYHEKFATNAFILMLAIQDKEDELFVIVDKEAQNSDTAEDRSRKSRLLLRLKDLKKKLEKIE